MKHAIADQQIEILVDMDARIAEFGAADQECRHQQDGIWQQPVPAGQGHRACLRSGRRDMRHRLRHVTVAAAAKFQTDPTIAPAIPASHHRCRSA